MNTAIDIDATPSRAVIHVDAGFSTIVDLLQNRQDARYPLSAALRRAHV